MKRKKNSLKDCLRDEKKRKSFIVGIAVFIIVFIGLNLYQINAEGRQGDLILLNEESGKNNVVEENPDIDSATVNENENVNININSDLNAPAEEEISSDVTGTADPGNGVIFVDVGGSVNIAGLFALPKGSRVDDAIDAAGGLCEDAEMKYLNRATVLADGDRLYVPTASEVQDGTAPPSVGQVTAAGGYGGDTSTGSVTNGSTGNNAAGQGLINLNTASSDELQKLNGVGPATAQKIIDYRTKNGSFKRIEELMNVSGIGVKTYEKFRDYITV